MSYFEHTSKKRNCLRKVAQRIIQLVLIDQQIFPLNCQGSCWLQLTPQGALANTTDNTLPWITDTIPSGNTAMYVSNSKWEPQLLAKGRGSHVYTAQYI